MNRRLLIAVALALLAGSGWLVRAARADGAWLDGPPPAWNSPGMPVPAAPPRDQYEPFGNDDPSRCGQTDRPPQTAEDEAVAAAGWKLFGRFEGGWGIVILSGLTGHDGMCRPLGFQHFVFVDGVFAGTLSPIVMDSRVDGSGGLPSLGPPSDTLQAQFARYTATDPLCCPSRITDATYSVERTADGPVVRLTSTSSRATPQP